MAFLLESFLRIEAKCKIYPNEIQRNQSANNFLSLKGAVTQEATAPSRAHRKRKCSDLGKNPQLGCSQIGYLQSGNFPDCRVTQIGDFSYIFSKSEVISPIWVVIPRSMIFHAGVLVTL